MNKMLLKTSLLCALALPSTVAPEASAEPAPVGSIKSAQVTPFISGLGDPQGLAFNDYKDGDLTVADYAKGDIVEYNFEGKRRAVQANGLQGPTQLVSLPGGFYVAESKAGRVLIGYFSMISQLGDSINSPVGVIISSERSVTPAPYVVSQSGKVSHLVPISNGIKEDARAREFNWKTIYEPTTPNAPDAIAPAIALDGDNILLTVPATGEVKLITSNGRASTLAQGLNKPTFITTGANGEFYVGDESNGGQLWRVEGNGEKSVVATGLGRPRAMVFGKPNTAYVADRNGNVWKLSWQQ